MKPREHPCEAAIEITGVSQVCDDGSQVCSGTLYILQQSNQRPVPPSSELMQNVESGQNQAMPQWVLQSVQCLHLYTWLSISTTHGPWASN